MALLTVEKIHKRLHVIEAACRCVVVLVIVSAIVNGQFSCELAQLHVCELQRPVFRFQTRAKAQS
jgi:hypothetical protein